MFLYIPFAAQSFGEEYICVAEFGQDKMEFPHGIAIDPSGNVYVCGTDAIQKFTPDGKYITTIGKGKLNSPHEIAIDKNNIFVLDLSGKKIVAKFSADGTFNKTLNIDDVAGIAINSAPTINLGSIYVLNMKNRTIALYTSNGDKVAQHHIDKFMQEITSDSSGNVFFASDSEIGKLNFKTGKLTTWNKQFNVPRGIAVDQSGNIYVVDRNPEKISKFDPAGTFLTQIGKEGKGKGGLSAAFGLAVDSKGFVYATDYVPGNLSHVKKFMNAALLKKSKQLFKKLPIDTPKQEDIK